MANPSNFSDPNANWRRGPKGLSEDVGKDFANSWYMYGDKNKKLAEPLTAEEIASKVASGGPGQYDQPPMQGGGDDAGIRQAIAERFPDVQPDKLDEIYQAWEEHSHWAEREGEQPDLEQFFQQYEADAQGFGGGGTNPDLPPEVLARIKEGQGQEQMQEMPSEAMQQQGMMQNPELDQNSYRQQPFQRAVLLSEPGGKLPQPYGSTPRPRGYR